MPAAFWGTVTAISWGSADFIARFTSGRLGLLAALCGMMVASCVLLVAYALASGMPWVAPGEAWWAPLGASVFIVVGTLLLYWGLVRGPISVVSPIVAAYPVFSIGFALAEGLRPDLLQWLAIGGVLLGVAVVARYGRDADSRAEAPPGGLPLTVLIAIGSAFTFALGIWFLQRSQPVYGELQSLIAVRVFGALATLLLLFLLPSHRKPVPWRWWPVLAFQGLLDGGAYLAIQIGSRGPDAAVAVVVASTFCLVPVLLARLVLREAITLPQWLGIALTAASVAVVSA